MLIKQRGVPGGGPERRRCMGALLVILLLAFIAGRLGL